MWSRFATRSIRAINAVHRVAVNLKHRAPRALSSAAPYAIGIPLLIAVPAGGILIGLRLAHDPTFAAAKAPLVDPLITAGFFLAGVFFSSVRIFGLLPALGIAAFLVLALFLLCAKVVGALAITAVRGDRQPRPTGEPTPASRPEFGEPAETEAEAGNLHMWASLRR